MKKICLTEEDVKGISILDSVFFAIRTKRLKNAPFNFEENEIFHNAAQTINKSVGGREMSYEVDLLQKMLETLSIGVFCAEVVLKLPDKLVRLQYNNNQIIDLSDWQLSNIEPISNYYKENEIKWEQNPNGLEIFLDSLEPFKEYEKRQVMARNRDGGITISPGETGEQIIEKALGKKNKGR